MGVPQLMSILEPNVIWDHTKGYCTSVGKAVEAHVSPGQFFEGWHRGGRAVSLPVDPLSLLLLSMGYAQNLGQPRLCYCARHLASTAVQASDLSIKCGLNSSLSLAIKA